MRLILFILSCLGQLSFAQLTEWDIADAKIARYSPDSFPGLPEAIRSYLGNKNYTIPQSYLNRSPHNVISGKFNHDEQTDWAVLASKNRASEILIFWNGELRKVSSIGKAADKMYLREVADKTIVFSRYIGLIAKGMAFNHIKKEHVKENVIKDQEGIRDHFLDSTSYVYYYADGSWYNFVGHD